MASKILVPLDGSGTAEAALPHALNLATITGSDLVLLNALASPVLIGATPWGTNTRGYSDSTEDLGAPLSGYLNDLSTKIRNCGLRSHVTISDREPAAAIVSYADAHAEVIMVVMSTHGRTGPSRWVLGSVAEKVVHALPVPALIVRPRGAQRVSALPAHLPEPVAPYSMAVVPLDGSLVAEQALVEVRRLAAGTRLRVLLVSAISPLESRGYYSDAVRPSRAIDARHGEADRLAEYLNSTARMLDAEGLDVATRLELGRPAEVILRAAEQERAGLVIMATHGRSGVQKLWLGSVASKVVQGATTPVLLVRAARN
jgi:nucleotide-binding universal stress UspA family protein